MKDGKLSPGRWLTLEQEALKLKTNEKTLIDLTAYQGIALWWFTRFRLFNPAKSTKWVRGLTRNTYMFSLADFMYDFSTLIICRMISRFLRKNTDRTKPTVLMTVNDRDWKSLRDPTGGSRKGDIFFQSLIYELQKRGFRIVTTTPLRSPIAGLKTMIDRLKHQQQNLIHREFNTYWSMKISKMEYEAKRHFRNSWKNASKNDAKFMKPLEKYGFSNELFTYFNSILGYVVKTLQ